MIKENSKSEPSTEAGNIAKPLLPDVFRHIPTGHTGFFIKEYKPTGRPLTMQIKLLDNRIWFAPKCEFERLSK
jgi:hypothetical protein